MMRSFGRLGERSSGVGGWISMKIAGASVGRVGIGRRICGIFRFGIPISGQCASLHISFIPPLPLVFLLDFCC